jgi:hypothetical protein
VGPVGVTVHTKDVHCVPQRPQARMNFLNILPQADVVYAQLRFLGRDAMLPSAVPCT